MNIKAVKKHILEELAHGKPVQMILNPKPPQVKVVDGEGLITLSDDPDWLRPELPDWNLVVQWLGDDEVFRREYEHAMKYGAAYLADEMLVLKDKLLDDPKSAPAYKAAMDMIKWATMIRDPKYSERTIQEIKNTAPQDADTVKSRIAQLEAELGLNTVNVEAVEVVEPGKKQISERMRLHLEKARATRQANIERRKQEKDDGGNQS
jgi:hypothetical protein